MATRSQIRVIAGDSCINLYHHYDGYFEGVGMTLHKALERCSFSGLSFLAALTEADDDFELTSSPHGDIEYWYLLDFDKKKFIGYRVDHGETEWRSPWPADAEFKDPACMPRRDKSKAVLNLLDFSMKEPGDVQ